MHGLGPVQREDNVSVVHEKWWSRAIAHFASTYVFAGYAVDEFATRSEVSSRRTTSNPRIASIGYSRSRML